MEKERVVVKPLRARGGGGPPTRRTGFARRIAAIFGAESQSPSGSGWGPIPAGHPRSQPCPGPRRSFLPVSLCRKLQVLEVDAARASRPFIHLASPKDDGARAPMSSRSSGEPQPRSGAQRILSPRSLLPPGWRSDSEARSFEKSPEGVYNACWIKFGGDLGLRGGGQSPGRARCFSTRPAA